MNKETIDKKDLQFNTEIYEILKELGEDYIKKIPSQLYSYFENNRKENSIFEIDINRPLEEQEVMHEVLLFIAYLNLQYWATEKEKQILLKKYKELDEIEELAKKEKYNPDNIFKTQPKDKNNLCMDNSKQQRMIVYKKNSFLERIKVIFKHLLKKFIFFQNNSN